jgi:hypothetical protein
LSLIETEALLVPVAVGVKVTLMVQSAPAATLVPQVFVWAKSPGSVPVMLTLVILRLTLPTFVSVTVFAALVCPTLTLPKFSPPGANCTAVAVPARLTV